MRGVQYGDWDGTAAADNADVQLTTIYDFLEKKGELNRHTEFLLAVNIWSGENKGGGKLDPVYVSVYIFEGYNSYDNVQAELKYLGNEAIPVREARFEMPIEEFIMFFKRFDVMLVRDLGLEDREYRVTNQYGLELI